jgi:hypothetical protein
MDDEREVSAQIDTVRFGEVEAALVATSGMQPEDIRARLRHLRRLGIPTGLPQTGSGTPIAYTAVQALEACFALRLGAIGTTPKVLAPLVRVILGEYRRHESSPTSRAMGDLSVVIFPRDMDPQEYSRFFRAIRRHETGTPPFMIFRGIDAWPTFEAQPPDAYTRMNISSIARKFFSALEKAVEER